MNISTQTFKH